MNHAGDHSTPPTIEELESWSARIDSFRLNFLLEKLRGDVDPAWSRRIQLHQLREAMRSRELGLSGLQQLVDRFEAQGDFQRSYAAIQARLANV